MKNGGGTGMIRNEREALLGKTIDAKDIPVEYGQYSDERLKELEAEMEERNWGREDTAWERACAINTKDSYKKFIAMYPYGPHRAEASKRLVDLEVEDIFNGKHGKLPSLTHVSDQPDSPKSTVVVENATQYTLTVMYSGTESRVMKISPGSKGAITLTNGFYKIAASVPPAHIRPFAGTEVLSGGRYETGFCVVTYRF